MSAEDKRIQFLITYVHDKKVAREVLQGLKDIGNQSDRTGMDLGKLAQRAALTIPIWLALRKAFLIVTESIRDSINNIRDLDQALARMSAVTQQVSDLPAFMSQLSDETKRLARDSGLSIEEVSKAYINFAETGMKGTEAQAGMNTAIRLSVGTFSDLAQTSRMLVDIYNLYGKTLPATMSAQEKMNYIAGISVVLWEKNTGKFEEYIATSQNFLGVAKAWNLDLKQTLTLITTIQNSAQRAGIAGSRLSAALTSLTRSKDIIGDFLGRDIEKNVDYFQLLSDIMTKLNSEISKGKDVSDWVEKIFGEKAQKGVLGLTGVLEKFKSVYGEIKNLTLQEATMRLQEHYESQLNTLNAQLNRFKQIKDQMGAEFLKGFFNIEAEDAISGLKKLNEYLSGDFMKTIKDIGAEVRNITASFALIMTILKWKQALKIGAIGGATYLGSQVIGAFNDIGKLDKEQKERTLNLFRSSGEKGEPFPSTIAPQFKSFSSKDAVAELKAAWEEGKKKFESERVQLEPITIVKEPFDEPDAFKKVEREEEINVLYKDRLVMLERLKTYGYNDIDIQVLKLRLIEEQKGKTEEYLVEQRKLVEMVNAEIVKLSQTLQTAFSEGLKSLFDNESTLLGFFQKIGDAWTNTFKQSTAEGLTESIFKSTGIGEIFGTSMFNTKKMFGGIGGQVQGSIEEGFNAGAKATYTAIVKGFMDGSSGNYGLTGVFGSVGSSSSSMGGGGGLFSSLFGGGSSNYISPKWKGQKNIEGGTIGGGSSFGQMLGMGAMAAMTGYSMYQSAAAGGISQGQAIGSGVLGGVGSGLMMIAAANAWNPVGWTIAIGTTVAGMLMGTLGGKKSSQTQIETRVTESRISSKIDISNKQLEIVNRNLVALRASFETYILPNSAYFAEKTNLSDQFAMSSMRGGVS